MGQADQQPGQDAWRRFSIRLAAHIRTIKKRLIIIGVTILVALMVAFTFSGDMVAWLNRPFPNQLVFYGPTEALFASIKVSFLAAILASLPVIFYQCWKFIEPALLPKEQRWGIPLFAAGGRAVCLRFDLLQSRHSPAGHRFLRQLRHGSGCHTAIECRHLYRLQRRSSAHIRMCVRIAAGTHASWLVSELSRHRCWRNIANMRSWPH